MRNQNIIVVLSLMFLMASADYVTSANVQSGANTIAKNNSAFALDLYQELRTSQSNIFFSPYSVSTALAMTYAGAQGNTEKQMAEVLRFSLEQNKLNPAFAELQSRLKEVEKSGNVKLHIANSLWPDKTYELLKEYLSLAKKYYDVSITPVDYQHAHEAAREMINKWAEEKTQGKIKNVIESGVLNDLTRLILVNAIYFKGNWDNQFEPEQTKEKPFFVSSKESVQVPMMTQKHTFRYAELDNLQILELPYAGNELSMLVVLPKAKDGLDKLEKSLSVKKLNRWKKKLKDKEEVLVFLPKFKSTSDFRLAQSLISMGMVDAFTPQANFTGMVSRGDLFFIGDVIHKAFVDVNERGTEAAAVTAVIEIGTASAPAIPTFRADHPFIFLIQENSTGSILFMGRVTNPAKADK